MKVNAISPDSCSLSLYILIVNRLNTTHFDYALKMTTAQVVETSVTVSNSPIQDYVYPDDHAQPTYEMTPGFKPSHILYKSNFRFLKTRKATAEANYVHFYFYRILY